MDTLLLIFLGACCFALGWLTRGRGERKTTVAKGDMDDLIDLIIEFEKPEENRDWEKN